MNFLKIFFSELKNISKDQLIKMSASAPSSPFATDLVNNVVQPAYRDQLVNGIKQVAAWKAWGYYLYTLSMILAGASTLLGSWSVYSSDLLFTYLATSLNAVSHIIQGISQYCFTEEKKAANDNNQILAAVGAHMQMLVPNDDPSEQSRIVSAAPGNGDNIENNA